MGRAASSVGTSVHAAVQQELFGVWGRMSVQELGDELERNLQDSTGSDEFLNFSSQCRSVICSSFFLQSSHYVSANSVAGKHGTDTGRLVSKISVVQLVPAVGLKRGVLGPTDKKLGSRILAVFIVRFCWIYCSILAYSCDILVLPEAWTYLKMRQVLDQSSAHKFWWLTVTCSDCAMHMIAYEV